METVQKPLQFFMDGKDGFRHDGVCGWMYVIMRGWVEGVGVWCGDRLSRF